MVANIFPVPDADANARWLAWRRHGAEADKRSDTLMGRLTLLAAMGLVIRLFVQLV